MSTASLQNDKLADKKADLAGPGVVDYVELEKVLPKNYHSILDVRQTQEAIFHLRRYIEDNLYCELNLIMDQVQLLVHVESEVNDMLDHDRSRTPIQFH